MTPTQEEVGELLARYREALVEWGESRDDAKKANRLFDQQQGLHKELRRSDAGQRAISSLVNDPIIAVRLMAAVHSLQWQRQAAEAVLEEIEQGEYGLFSVDAKWTLRSFRSGTLDLEW